MVNRTLGNSRQGRALIGALVLVCALAFAWPTTASAQQTALGFERDWLVLGPYVRDVGGANPGVAEMRRDYLTDGGLVTENNFVPAIGAVANTNYVSAASSNLLDRPGNGYPNPTVKLWRDADDTIDINGASQVYPPPTGQNNNNTMVYAWCYARNKTGAPLSCYLAVGSDDSIQVKINGVEAGIANVNRVYGASNTVQDVWPVTLAPGNSLVMVKVFNGSSEFGFRLRFQTNPALGTAQDYNRIPTSQLELFAVPVVSSPVRIIPGVGVVDAGSPQTVKVVLGGKVGTPSPTVVEVPPAGSMVANINATAGSAGYAGGRITWQITNMTDDVATMTYLTTTGGGNGYCSGTVTTAVPVAIGGDNILFQTNPIGVFDAHGLTGIPPLGTPPGDPATSGGAIFSSAIYSVNSSGGDVWGTVDRCYMLVKRTTDTSFIATANVWWTSTTTHASCKTGLMIRGKVSGGSPYGCSEIRNPINPGGTPPGQPQPAGMFQCRELANAGSFWSGMVVPTSTQPATLRIVRRGNLIDGYHYFNGMWNRLPGSPRVVSDLTPTGEVLLGYFVTSHVTAGEAQAQMNNLTIINTVPVLSATRRLSDTRPSSLPITVTIGIRYNSPSNPLTVTDLVPPSWTISDPNPVTGAVINGTTITWTIPSFTDDTTLTYTATPPAVHPMGVQAFTGTVVDQYGIMTVIGGDANVIGADVFLYRYGRLPTASYTGAQDAHLVQWTFTLNNNGFGDYIEEGNNQADNTDIRMPVLKFDLEGITPLSVIEEAKLRLCHWRNRGGLGAPGFTGPHTIYASRLLRDWNEGTGSGGDGRLSLDAEVNWYWARYNQDRWEMGGARGPTDMSPPESSAIASSQTINRWIEWDVLQMAREWAANPRRNFGLKLAQDNAVGTSATLWVTGFPNFRSKDYAADPNLRPILLLRAYTPPSMGANRWQLYR